MKPTILNLIALIKEDLAHDIKAGNKEIREIVLKAYNQYEDTEHDGVDYLFDLNNQNDLKCCVKGGMGAKEIAHLYFDMKAHHFTPYFFFGVNYDTPQGIATEEHLNDILIGYLEDVLAHVIAYPYSGKAYENLYRLCITEYMINLDMV